MKRILRIVRPIEKATMFKSACLKRVSPASTDASVSKSRCMAVSSFSPSPTAWFGREGWSDDALRSLMCVCGFMQEDIPHSRTSGKMPAYTMGCAGRKPGKGSPVFSPPAAKHCLCPPQPLLTPSLRMTGLEVLLTLRPSHS